MRRWQEFGSNTGTLFSDDTIILEKPDDEFQPVFISMPHKGKMLDILQSLMPRGDRAKYCRPLMICTYGGSTDAPDPACTAEHFQFNNPFGLRVGGLALTGAWQFLLAGFPTVDGFSQALFDFSFEPPDKFGG